MTKESKSAKTEGYHNVNGKFIAESTNGFANVASVKSVQTATNAANKNNILPQTGAENSNAKTLGVVGLALATALTMLGFNKKRQHN